MRIIEVVAAADSIREDNHSFRLSEFVRLAALSEEEAKFPTIPAAQAAVKKAFTAILRILHSMA